ncbi:hypothetical protein VCSRO141_2311 [Vibrio cholerae]|nr:hypothetical protein VCSRO141_2311 [Vibrio cholerae]
MRLGLLESVTQLNSHALSQTTGFIFSPNIVFVAIGLGLQVGEKTLSYAALFLFN